MLPFVELDASRVRLAPGQALLRARDYQDYLSANRLVEAARERAAEIEREAHEVYQEQKRLGWLGALLHGQALRQVLDGARVRRIRAQIGEQGQRFCLEQLDLLIGRWPPGWQRALPENPEDGYFRRCGLAFWLAACSDADCGFSRRLRLRLEAMPAPADWTFDEQRRSLARTLCLKVARQASDECFHLLN